MAGAQLSDLLSKLTLDSEKEDTLSHYLASIRRKKIPLIFSKNAFFVQELKKSNWVYLMCRKIKDNLFWGCSQCQDLNTFMNIKNHENLVDTYCIHAQAAFMLIGDASTAPAYDTIEDTVEVISSKPYYAVAHVGNMPSIIHFPRQTKSANCSMHPGAHKAGKSKCEHLIAHEAKCKKEAEKEVSFNEPKARLKPAEPMVKDRIMSDNPFGIKIDLIPTLTEQLKYNDFNFKFPQNLIPNPVDKVCEHGNRYCSKESAVERYLITSDKVHIHDILPVNDSRDSICRMYYLDTVSQAHNNLPCSCQLQYTGEEDLLLPVSNSNRKTSHLVTYRLLYDFFLLEMTDGTSVSGYIAAFNRRRRMLCGSTAKECCAKVWKQAVKDFESALSTDEVEAFSCSKCPSENSPGDGLDEVHIGDGISEGMQVDHLPLEVKNFKELVPGIFSNFIIATTFYQAMSNISEKNSLIVTFLEQRFQRNLGSFTFNHMRVGYQYQSCHYTHVCLNILCNDLACRSMLFKILKSM